MGGDRRHHRVLGRIERILHIREQQCVRVRERYMKKIAYKSEHVTHHRGLAASGNSYTLTD